jgi:type VI protein secretion system component VasF
LGMPAGVWATMGIFGQARRKRDCRFRRGHPLRRPSEKTPMTVDQLAKELHELKRRRETPLPLIEMADELLSLAPRLSAKQRRKRSDQIMATALKRLERKDA